jgi:hypothetical protein
VDGWDVPFVPLCPEEIARFQALEGKTWNIPAIAEGRLIVRNTTDMACFRIAGSR